MSQPADGEFLAIVRQIADHLRAELSAVEQLLIQNPADSQAEPQLFQAIDSCLDELAQSECWGPANRLPSSELWRACESWLARGEMQLHARTKPRGYAGDFELLSRIYQQYCCADSLGSLFDRYFQNHAAPRAVRERRSRLGHTIRSTCNRISGPVQIASVGSGPATEVVDAFRETPEVDQRRVNITLFDMDPAALEFACHEIERSCFCGALDAQRINLGRLATHSDWSRAAGRFHLVYCAGLFDYLEDSAAIEFVQLFDQWLISGGESLVFNFAPTNPSRPYMEWIGNWYLIYRDVVAMQQLVRRAELDDRQCKIESFAEGVLVLAELQKR